MESQTFRGKNALLKNLPSIETSSYGINNTQKNKKQVPLPTTTNNKIKLMTTVLFEIYGKDGKMYYEEFSKWVNNHIKFLESIQEWFRPSLWKLKEDP